MRGQESPCAKRRPGAAPTIPMRGQEARRDRRRVTRSTIPMRGQEAVRRSQTSRRSANHPHEGSGGDRRLARADAGPTIPMRGQEIPNGRRRGEGGQPSP